MTEFSSVQEMLEQLVSQKVEENREWLANHDNILKMTTTWLVDEGIELIFGHEKLGIPFQNIHIIVNSFFFKPQALNKAYPEAYHRLSKNAKWESIDTIVKRGDSVEVNPIAFISLISCFKGRSSRRQPNLAAVLDHFTYPSTRKRLIVVLSSENDIQNKTTEINDAKEIIISKFANVTIEEFNISDERGGYHGFTASF